MLFWRRYILFRFLNTGFIISVSVVLRKIKILYSYYLCFFKIPKRHSSNTSDYVNMNEITSTQHYTRLVWKRFPEEKVFENDRKETASKAGTSIWHRNNIEKSTWRTRRYFVDFSCGIHVEISTSNRFPSFKIDEISTIFSRGISTSTRWQIDEDVSIGEYSRVLNNPGCLKCLNIREYL